MDDYRAFQTRSIFVDKSEEMEPKNGGIFYFIV